MPYFEVTFEYAGEWQTMESQHFVIQVDDEDRDLLDDPERIAEALGWEYEDGEPYSYVEHVIPHIRRGELSLNDVEGPPADHEDFGLLQPEGYEYDEIHTDLFEEYGEVYHRTWNGYAEITFVLVPGPEWEHLETRNLLDGE